MTAPILVTGGTGTLGRAVVARLRQAGSEIRTAVRILADILNGSDHHGSAYRQLPTSFVLGASCGCDPAVHRG